MVCSRKQRNAAKIQSKKNQKKFAKLQSKWYTKLAKSGFVDLEWHDEKTGRGQNTPFLKKKLNKFKDLSKTQLLERAKYFIDASAFADEYEFPSRLHSYVWQLYTEGVSYRDMIPLIKRRGFKNVPSIFWISEHLNQLKRDYDLWQLDQPDEAETLSDFMQNNDRCF